MGNRNPKVSYTLHIVAGIYVAYLGISSLRTAIKEGSGIPLPAVIAITVVLTVLGVICLISGLKGYKYLKDHPEEFEDPEETVEEDAVEEEAAEEPKPSAPAPSSIMAKASMPDYLKVDDEDQEEDADSEE